MFKWSQYSNTLINSSTAKDYVYFQNMFYFQIFYLLCMLYLITSSLQIRYGEPINKGKRELLSKFNAVYKGINNGIRSIPFFYTIAVIIDFMLTTSGLDLFEWISFESIYNTLYQTIMLIRAKKNRIPGLKINFVPKFGVGIILGTSQILLLI